MCSSDLPCEPVSVKFPSEPEKLHRLDITQINEAIEATKLQPLSQDSMEHQTVSKEACKSSLKAALSQEIHSYIKNANHSIENLTNNGELETCDGQLLLIQHQPRLRIYLTVLKVIYNTVTVKKKLNSDFVR